MTSWISVRTMRFFNRASVVGVNHDHPQVRSQEGERGLVDRRAGKPPTPG